MAIHDQSLLDGETVGSVPGSSTYLPPGRHPDPRIGLDEPMPDGTFGLVAIVYGDTDDATFDYVSSEGPRRGLPASDPSPNRQSNVVSP